MLQTSPAAIGFSEAAEQERRSSITEKRRAYNREYMRAWRANPRHQACERAAREKSYCRRKLREALRERQTQPAMAGRPFTNGRGMPVCAFCGKSGPVEEVVRLKIDEASHGEYVVVRLPYCGAC